MRVPWQRGAEQSRTQDDHLWGGIFDLRHHKMMIMSFIMTKYSCAQDNNLRRGGIFDLIPDQQYLVNFHLRHVKSLISNLWSILGQFLHPFFRTRMWWWSRWWWWWYRSWWWFNEYDDNTSQDEEQRQKLNRITHPEIYKEMIWEAVRCFSWIWVLSIASVGYYSLQLY